MAASDKIYEGEVCKWVDRTSGSSFGFIEYELRSCQDRIYFSERSIAPNAVGCTCDARAIRTPVRFRIRAERGRPYAIEVTPVSRRDGDGGEYREISVVERIFENYAFLLRKCGEELFLDSRDVVAAFRGRWATLEPGSKIYHGIAAPDEKHRTFRAVAAEIFAPGEAPC